MPRKPNSRPAPGLSPRVRGKLDFQHDAYPALGSIPACAGEAHLRFFNGLKTAVYPRVCGGSDASRLACLLRAGLSPRVRGKPGRKRPVSLVVGSIPACAGEAWSTGGNGGTGRVYPRVCGGSPY